VIRSNIGLVYQPERQSESQSERAGVRVWSDARASEGKRLITSCTRCIGHTDSRMGYSPQVG
jgi:hypothetical protein